MVMAEWADDKIRALETSGLSTIVITGISSQAQSNIRTKYVKIPSLSWRDFKFERTQVSDKSLKLKVVVALFYPISAIFGRIFDLFTRCIITEENPARWSWTFSSLPVVIYLKIRFRIKIIFATGGALSAQLIASLIHKSKATKIFVEFQDPIVGNGINRTVLNNILIKLVEKFIIWRTRKTFFVTEKASESAIMRNPKLEKKISYMYPGSWHFGINSPPSKVASKAISIMHIGTLYGSRNMDNFFLALDTLGNNANLKKREIIITNVGAIYLENLSYYLEREDFFQLPEVQRAKALELASKADILLLIQHQDDRSLETIPYKTYDYLNLNLKIFALSNNPELDKIILESNGIVARANSVIDILNALKFILKESTFGNQRLKKINLNLTKQFLTLLELCQPDEARSDENPQT